MTKKEAFEILESENNSVPYEAIEFLYNHEKDQEITEKVIYYIKNAYNNEVCFNPTNGYYSEAPVWYSILAEKHHSDGILKPVISLFSTVEEDWDLLSEQGLYLVGLLSEKYGNEFIEKVIKKIETLSDEDSATPYLYLFNAILYCNIDTYKDRLIEILKKDFLYADHLAVTLSEFGIKEIEPIIKDKLEILKTLEQTEPVKYSINEYLTALERINATHSNKEDLMLNYYKGRNNWKEHYKEMEKYIYDSKEEAQEPSISDKTQRNDPCPCGSGKKFKKCCGLN